MFMCRECHKREEEKGICSALHFDSSFALSRGACELCGEVATCVDCKAYKYVKEKEWTGKQ